MMAYYENVNKSSGFMKVGNLLTSWEIVEF
jgi:hypothetical protein